MQDSSAVPLTFHTAGRKQTSWFVWTPWCFAPSSVQGGPFNLLQHCNLIATLRHTRALLTANALLTSSAANQMLGKTTSRNVNNANCGQPRGPIGACACRLLQLCLPLPLSVHLFSISLFLSLSESSFVRVFLLPLTFYIILFCFVSPRCPITWKRKFAERDSCCCRKFKLKCKGKKPATMKRHLSDSEPEINEDYDECSR